MTHPVNEAYKKEHAAEKAFLDAFGEDGGEIIRKLSEYNHEAACNFVRMLHTWANCRLRRRLVELAHYATEKEIP